MHKDTKWAKDIIALQQPDGKWGCFHSLSQSYQSPITTEQALRRLQILGYTIEDPCIQKAVQYMHNCLTGKDAIPDRLEKTHDWDTFTNLLLAAWIRRFTQQDAAANEVAEKWAAVISAAFAGGTYNHEQYGKAYRETFSAPPKGDRLVDFVHFYPLSLLRGCLEQAVESAFVDHVLHWEPGIYYVYGSALCTLPPDFASKQASRYLGAVELLSAYRTSRAQLSFVADWLERNRNENGKWDMGSTVHDKLYFPLSDTWRKKGVREADCTERITKLLDTLVQGDVSKL